MEEICYEKVYVQTNIETAVLQAGVMPVNTTKRLVCHSPKSDKKPDVMVSPDTLKAFLEI